MEGFILSTLIITKGVGTNMISNIHRQKLAAWFLNKNNSQFYSQLKLQKFLFFYETFSKSEYGTSDFTSLKAYKNGPVYSDVYGDFTYRQQDFVKVLSELGTNTDGIDENIAEYVHFIVSILNEEELSDLTHELNMWKVHKENIEQGVLHLSMSESDFNYNDSLFIKELMSMYSDLNISELEIYTVNTTNFVIEKSLKERLTKEQESVLFTIADHGLNNPVFVTVSEDGVLEID